MPSIDAGRGRRCPDSSGRRPCCDSAPIMLTDQEEHAGFLCLPHLLGKTEPFGAGRIVNPISSADDARQSGELSLEHYHDRRKEKVCGREIRNHQ